MPGTLRAMSRRSANGVTTLVWAAWLVAATLPGAAQPRGPAIGGTASKTVVRPTAHLSLTATIAPATIAPGGRVALSVSVTPHPGMHVYAPGSKYRAVTITLPPRSGFRLEAPIAYPKPVPYVFKPLNETVRVYDAPFRLVARIGLDPATPAVVVPPTRDEIALNASLDYQACDDRVCYLPESVPLRWTVRRLPSTAP